MIYVRKRLVAAGFGHPLSGNAAEYFSLKWMIYCPNSSIACDSFDEVRRRIWNYLRSEWPPPARPNVAEEK